MSEEPCTLEEFWEELENLPRRTKAYYAARRKVLAILRSPKTLRRKIRLVVQRARRGWADEDTWSFDHYLSSVIAGGVRRLQKDSHGHPAGLCDCEDPWGMHEECNGPEKWDAILDEMAAGFEAHERDFATGEFTHEDEKKLERSLDLLHLYYRALWD